MTVAPLAEVEAPIGVFDSGIGGLSVLRALRAALPTERFVYFADTAHAPYGERTHAAIAARTLQIGQDLITRHAIKALVIACNTATAAGLDTLRKRWPRLPVVGVEPALRPAIRATRTGHVAVMATRATITSERYQRLQRALGWQTTFHPVGCDGLARAVEQQNATEIIALCAYYAGAAGRYGNEAGCIDTLVLGCTHYAFAEAGFRRAVGEAVTLFESGPAVAHHMARLLTLTGRQARQGHAQTLMETSGPPDALAAHAERWL